MGCGASKSTVVGYDKLTDLGDIDESWHRAMDTLEVKRGESNPNKNIVIKRSGWKTIRIFVSSTFRDFHAEREVLVKKVFPDLRVWCESRRLQLIECDLRWGVPKDFTTEGTLRACLGEIDRCYQDNIMPYFVNMTSERVGWIPDKTEVPDNIKDEYKWIEGLSVTEMEIMHGAYRNDNPNALFLLRNDSFIDKVPEEYKKLFIDENDIAPVKLQTLKKMIKDRFPDNRLARYDVEYSGYDEVSNVVQFSGLDGTFSKTVFDFFKQRIESQYPLLSLDQVEKYQHMKDQHESFMKNRSESVLGRDDIQKTIKSYIEDIGNDVPFMLLGGAGSGKSSLMAKIADDTYTRAMNGRIKGGGKSGWHVFYHFVGAVPGSTELELMLRRLLKEIGISNEQNMPKDLDAAAQMVCGALNNPNTRPLIMVVDALNQFDEDKAAQLVSWIPSKLAPHVRVVVSMIPETEQHQVLQKREPTPQIFNVTPLHREDKEAIVEELLGRYNKRLDAEQMDNLLSKSSSDNPLWLSIACEELRVFGRFRQVSDKINQLADGLLELELQVLDRFEKENGGELLVASLCLLEVSVRGLLEAELLAIMADENNIMPPEDKDISNEKGKTKSKMATEMLPAYKWTEVYRALKPFLRPFGDSGEGRLDFYHRSLSKAVRKKYFQDSDGNSKAEIYEWWHNKLVDYFERTKNINRKLEEYPGHLIAVKDSERLAGFLSEWEIFDEMFDEEFSGKLISYWNEGADFEMMKSTYITKLQNMENSNDVSKEELSMANEKVSRFFAQCGQDVEATNLLDRAMSIEQEELGSKPERMVELYFLKAFIKDEKQRQAGFVEDEDTKHVAEIIEIYSKSVDLRRTMTSDKKHKNKLGITVSRLSFYYAEMNDRIENDGELLGYKKKDCFENALKYIDEAIDIFKELDDVVHMADCMVTKGVAYERGSSQQLKLYEEALEILLPVTGELHLSVNRSYLNIGIYYEDCRNYNKAFEWYHKWFASSKDLYGLEHPKTHRCYETLREPFYQRLARQKGIPVP